MVMSRRIQVVLLCFCLPAFSQQERGGRDQRISLDVVVTDKKGMPVAGLEQQDFTLLDNKKPSKIVSFQTVPGAAGTDTPPIEVILLIDRVNIDFTRAAGERQLVDKFLRQGNGQLPYPISMMSFSDSGTSMENPSSDGNALADNFDKTDSALRTVTRSQGVYGAIDRFQMSLNALNSVAAYEAKKPGRKVLIWVSPGWPLLSGPRTELTKKEQENLFAGIVSASTALRQARVSVYSIDPLGVADAGGLGISYYKEFVKGVSSPKQVQPGDLALQVFATQTGGLVLNSSNDIGAQIAVCFRDLKTYYILSFDSPPADGPNEYHALEVKIGKPGLAARTRTGYYAQP
jgi:VWFA-related protein